jgi:hypothetical protein
MPGRAQPHLRGVITPNGKIVRARRYSEGRYPAESAHVSVNGSQEKGVSG